RNAWGVAPNARRCPPVCRCDRRAFRAALRRAADVADALSGVAHVIAARDDRAVRLGRDPEAVAAAAHGEVVVAEHGALAPPGLLHVGLEAVDRRMNPVVADELPAVAFDIDPRVGAGGRDHTGAVEPVVLDEAVARALLDVEILRGRMGPE